MDLALNDLQRLICHKIKPNQHTNTEKESEGEREGRRERERGGMVRVDRYHTYINCSIMLNWKIVVTLVKKSIFF